MLIPLETLRNQVRLEYEDAASDNLLTLYAKAAAKAVESATGRKLYAVGELPAEPPENALVADEDVQLAMLLLVGHWFANREAVNVGNITSQLPLGFDALVSPYRWYRL